MTDGLEDGPTSRRGHPPAGLDTNLSAPAPRPQRVLAVAVLLALVAGVALWGALAGTGPGRADGAVLGEVLDARTGGLTALAVVVTTVGSTVAMALLAALAAASQWRRGRRPEAALLLAAMAGGVLLFRGLKILIDRPRPPVAARLAAGANESLPSGHATMAMVVLGSLVVLGWAGRGAPGRLLMVSAALLWIGAVGVTRVYLGVHWFSDVVAGWLVGAAWLAVCVAVWSWWRRRICAAAERTALSLGEAG